MNKDLLPSILKPVVESEYKIEQKPRTNGMLRSVSPAGKFQFLQLGLARICSVCWYKIVR